MLRRKSSASSNPPPSYTSDAASSAPPPAFTDFPDSYTVNKQSGILFVDNGDLQAHLKLLAAFNALRQKVEAGCKGVAAELEPKARWTVFLYVAVWRMELWLEQRAREPAASPYPPLDVLLIWHSARLNPLRFAEDRIRIHGDAIRLTDDQLKRIASHIPPLPAFASWEAHTSQTFDPILHFEETQGRPLVVEGAEYFAPWVTREGTGYAQQGFLASVTLSSGNKLAVTHESLGASRLAEDLVACQAKNDARASLAGTVVSTISCPSSPAESAQAVRVRSAVQKSKKLGGSVAEVNKLCKYSLQGAQAVLRTMVLTGRDITNILSRYTRGEPFSLDLAMAALRQGSFIQKMHDLGWLDLDRFSDDDTILSRCVARYHAFLDLISSAPSSFFVPTLDIDLAWHTHQLKSSYISDTMRVIGRAVDHDDKVAEGTLANGFDITAQAWRARFGVPYSTCGCPLPSQPPLSRFANRLGLSSSNTAYPSGPIAPSDADADATHPSEHNSLVVVGHPAAERARQQRQKELDSRRVRDAKALAKDVKNGKLPEYERVKREKQLERSNDHAFAFFAPFPIVPIYGPLGFPAGAGGCAASDGNQVCPPSTNIQCGTASNAQCGAGASAGGCGSTSCPPTSGFSSCASATHGGGSSSACGSGGGGGC
ncbi:protein of unknown function DUF1399 [Rhodotorula toruloides NP11]|uniref:Uncharacterized protein n=1 Tax=Rhodotorula toruloides (strain NP11) TaxID=1130832 RepID=M7XFX0_RHOT1|nr:protein of unknown function DUF1399 [Rhodotorula toruloides NP11]EMS19043.1 protein of unknown function DUF1399 [Rhodotorula toruloides NP11]